MKPNTQLRKAVRGFYAWIASMVLVGLAPIVAVRFAERQSTWERAVAVLLGAGGMVPWMWIVYTMIRRSDEFTRQIHLVAFGFAFGGALLLLSALHWMVRAGFMAYPDLIIVMGGAMVLWLAALLATKFYFERGR